MAPNFDFLHSMGISRGCAMLRVKGEAMRSRKILKFIVFNKQKEEDGKQRRIIYRC
jgi:hypothetical protein